MNEKIRTTHRRRGGVVIRSVAEASTAALCGLEPGDKVLTIDGHLIADGLSFSFNIRKPDLLMEVEKPNGDHWELAIEQDEEVSFGVELEEDPIMLCRNKCIFCFVDQNPKGYRPSLLIKDEDIRLSFMYGNYSTLSSTDRAEEERIIREKISPLYVSVHATDPETRIFMLKNKKCGDILERLRMFAANGIRFHAQIVLCPEINDGPILERTLDELASLAPACLSIAVVPLGITKHRVGLTRLTPVSDDYCARTIEFCRGFQARFEREIGDPLVYLGDELYIRAGEPIPPAKAYRDFPQMENGIGMVRRFLDQFNRALPRLNLPRGTSGTLVTGTLFGPILQGCMDRLNRRLGTNIRVAPIQNHAFGAELINVAGLVHGGDIVRQLKARDLGDFLVLPHVMLKDPEHEPILVDNMSLDRLSGRLDLPVYASGNTAADLVRSLSKITSWNEKLPVKTSPIPRGSFAV